jgi:hypothetical protein
MRAGLLSRRKRLIEKILEIENSGAAQVMLVGIQGLAVQPEKQAAAGNEFFSGHDPQDGF